MSRGHAKGINTISPHKVPDASQRIEKSGTIAGEKSLEIVVLEIKPSKIRANDKVER